MINKGQIVLISLLAGAATVLASVITAWGISNARVSSIDRQVGIIEEREGNHYNELKQLLESIDKKIDKIIEFKGQTNNNN